MGHLETVMNKQYYSVLEFTQAFGQPIPLKRALPPKALQELRGKLSIEESVEIRDAEDLKEYLDGCADLLYIAIGNFIAAGFQPEDIQAAMNEVHRSNMSKLWTHEEVMRTREIYSQEGEERMGLKSFDECFDVRIAPGFEDANGAAYIRYIVTRKDGKVVKPPSFSPPDFSAILP